MKIGFFRSWAWPMLRRARLKPARSGPGFPRSSSVLLMSPLVLAVPRSSPLSMTSTLVSINGSGLHCTYCDKTDIWSSSATGRRILLVEVDVLLRTLEAQVSLFSGLLLTLTLLMRFSRCYVAWLPLHRQVLLPSLPVRDHLPHQGPYRMQSLGLIAANPVQNGS